MRTIGLIGGTSWHSTIPYYRLINEGVGNVIGEQANPELIIYSINIELMREQNRPKIYQKYTEVAQKLEAAGAEAIVICANTPHMVYEHVQPKIGIPFLHIAHATGMEARRLGLTKLGLLGNKPTMTGDFIPKILKDSYGVETIIPEEDSLLQAHQYISRELTQGKFTPEARKFFLNQIHLLKNRGAAGIILGCTELPLLLKEGDADIPLIPTTQLHAQMAVNFILENDKNA